MKLILMFLLWSSMTYADPPYLVTQPHKYAVSSQYLAKPTTIQVNGLDEDLEALLTTPSSSWTWPGMTEASLRRHLVSEHGVDTSGLDFNQIKKVHSVLHERENKPKAKPTAPRQPAQRGSCPSGNCPQVRPKRQGFLFWN